MKKSRGEKSRDTVPLKFEYLGEFEIFFLKATRVFIRSPGRRDFIKKKNIGEKSRYTVPLRLIPLKKHSFAGIRTRDYRYGAHYVSHLATLQLTLGFNDDDDSGIAAIWLVR